MTDLEEFLTLLDRRSITYTVSWEGDFMEIKFRCGTHEGVVGDPGLTTSFRFNHKGILSEIENYGFVEKIRKVTNDNNDV